eukprot:TRINITY_DN1845_c4_g1_i1.p1 TRINITY_DN1845_c4_g1~~TRINITY_DN1845_c4_g1_i1.p1  ORF type:complete len:500 (-),score=59.51 TRINITY_DN1845_c4_g1_i1:33-1532(-)
MEGVPDYETADVIPFDHLVFERQIGAGSFGTVWQGNYLGTPVAIKVIAKSEDLQEELDIFVARERAMTKFAHPHLVQFVGVADHLSNLYLVTEYVHGGDLRRYLKDEKQDMGWRLRIQIGCDIARAMVFLHARKIMHRDLKSKNLLVDTNWKIKVCDFGFARSFETRSRGYTICGTEDWMAPELIMGMEYCEKVDVFSFGIVLCEIITRKKISTSLKRAPQHAFCLDPDELTKLVPPECPTTLLNITLRCCDYNPELRPSFREVLGELNELLEELKTQGSVLVQPGKLPSPRIIEPENPVVRSPMLSHHSSAVATAERTKNTLQHKFKLPKKSSIKKEGTPLHSVEKLTSLTFPDPQQFYSAIHTVTAKGNTSGWVLIGYAREKELCFQGSGRSIEDLARKLKDNEAQYMLVRVPVEPVTHGVNKGLPTCRDIFIAWLGPGLGMVSKGKKASHVGELKELLAPYHAELTAISKTKFSLATILSKSSPLSGSHVIDDLHD